MTKKKTKEEKNVERALGMYCSESDLAGKYSSAARFHDVMSRLCILSCLLNGAEIMEYKGDDAPCYMGETEIPSGALWDIQDDAKTFIVESPTPPDSEVRLYKKGPAIIDAIKEDIENVLRYQKHGSQHTRPVLVILFGEELVAEVEMDIAKIEDED